MKRKENKWSILDIFIIFLGIIFAASLIFMVKSFVEYSNLGMGRDFEPYHLEGEAYHQMLPQYYEIKIGEKKLKKNQKPYFAAAEYFEGALYRTMYEKMQDTQRVEEYEEQMERAAGNMGEFSFVKGNIDEKMSKFSTPYSGE